jgi:hypothetical protein
VDLEAQISLITNPQEFTRLCNAALSAEHGDDFLPIDDDRPDRGNDGFLKSEKRMYAAHCFKRVQNQSLDQAIRLKMIGDLGKAATLKKQGIWEVEAWTFLSNYPVPDEIAEQVVKLGRESGIDVSWRGPPFLAQAVRNHGLAASFPELHVVDIDARIGDLQESLEAMAPSDSSEEAAAIFHAVPETPNQQRRLLLHRPPGWEYLLYAGVLLQGKTALEAKWHDEELEMPRGERLAVEEESAMSYLSREMSRLRSLTGTSMRVFTREAQVRAFCAAGEPGDPVRIERLATHVVETYENMMDWAAGLRAMVPPEQYERVYALTASMAHLPLTQFRQFVDDIVRETARIPRHLAAASDEPLVIEVELILKIDQELLHEFEVEMDQLRQTLE